MTETHVLWLVSYALAGACVVLWSLLRDARRLVAALKAGNREKDEALTSLLHSPRYNLGALQDEWLLHVPANTTADAPKQVTR